MKKHVVLLGDSIFDNAVYVNTGEAVSDRLREYLGDDSEVSLLASDGATVAGVFGQLDRLPEDATQLFLSIGGNDALWVAGSVYSNTSANFQEALNVFANHAEEFRIEYERLLNQLEQTGLPVTVCTIYDSVPTLELSERALLCVFNDSITRFAFQFNMGLIDLRLICNEPEDYTGITPIEPSAQSSKKIARAINDAVNQRYSVSRIVTESANY